MSQAIIYLFCLPATWGGPDVVAYAIGADGQGVASHLCSNEHWAKHDLGLTSTWKHDQYENAYPGGFELVWVDDPDNHAGLQAALALNEAAYLAERGLSREVIPS